MNVAKVDAEVSSEPGDAVIDTVVATSPEELTHLRSRVRAVAADAGASPELASDLELVLSELATNVIRHTHASSMRVSVRVERIGPARRWTIQVDNDVVPTPIDAVMPDDAPTGGRGLRIVAAIMDDIIVTENHGRMTIKASRFVTG